MIRVSKHKISGITNQGKLDLLDRLLVDYKHDLEIYIKYIIGGVLPLQKQISSKLLQIENIKDSKYRREIYAHASSIIRSQIDKAEERRYGVYKKVYKYFKNNSRQLDFVSKKYSKLNKKDILLSKHFTIPTIKNLTISLGSEFIGFQDGNSFNYFIAIRLPYPNPKSKRGHSLKINIPFKHHRHSNQFKNNGYTQKSTITLKKVKDQYYISLIWEKESKLKEVVGNHKPDNQQGNQSSTLGIDTGYRRLIVTSNNQFLGSEMPKLYHKIVKAKRDSKNYKCLLTQRDNLVGFYCNQIDLTKINKVVVEDLKNVKFESKYNNKVNDLISRWVYSQVINKIKMICEANSIELEKVSPAYTSQTCSSCGKIHKESRNGDFFKCIECGFEIDADYNAAINIRNKGACSPLDQ